MAASRRLLARDANGREFEIVIAVGQPYEVSKDEWACPASIEGLHGAFPDMHGVDAWQATQLAYQIVARLLANFVGSGGQLIWLDEPIRPEDLFPKTSLL